MKPIIPGSGNDVDNPNIVQVSNLSDYQFGYAKQGFEGNKLFLFFEAGERHWEKKQTSAVDVEKIVHKFNFLNVYMMTFGKRHCIVAS